MTKYKKLVETTFTVYTFDDVVKERTEHSRHGFYILHISNYSDNDILIRQTDENTLKLSDEDTFEQMMCKDNDDLLVVNNSSNEWQIMSKYTFDKMFTENEKQEQYTKKSY